MGAMMIGYSALRKIPARAPAHRIPIAALVAGLALSAAAPPAFARRRAAGRRPGVFRLSWLRRHGEEAGGRRRPALHVPEDPFAKSVHSAMAAPAATPMSIIDGHPPRKTTSDERSFSLHDRGLPRMSCRQVRAMGDKHSRRAGAQRQSDRPRYARIAIIRTRSSRTRRRKSTKCPARNATRYLRRLLGSMHAQVPPQSPTATRRSAPAATAPIA